MQNHVMVDEILYAVTCYR